MAGRADRGSGAVRRGGAAQPFLKDLTQHQLGLLAPLTTRTMFHAGNGIFREGTPVEQFWLISDGRVTLGPLPVRVCMCLPTIQWAAKARAAKRRRSR